MFVFYVWYHNTVTMSLSFSFFGSFNTTNENWKQKQKPKRTISTIIEWTKLKTLNQTFNDSLTLFESNENFFSNKKITFLFLKTFLMKNYLFKVLHNQFVTVEWPIIQWQVFFSNVNQVMTVVWISCSIFWFTIHHLANCIQTQQVHHHYLWSRI